MYNQTKNIRITHQRATHKAYLHKAYLHKSKFTVNNKAAKVAKVSKSTTTGGGFMDFVIHEQKDKSTSLPFGLSKYDPSKYFDSTRVNPNMYRVLYNYGSPYEKDLTLKQNLVIPSSNVINKPHLLPADMNHYLFGLVEHPGTPKSRLLWLASYKNRSWERDILSYLSPLPKQGKTRAYALLVYKYPNETPVNNIYKPIDMTTAKRKEEFINFQRYLATNKTIQHLPGLTKYFKVQYDAGNALSFLSNMFGSKTKKTQSRIRTKLEMKR